MRTSIKYSLLVAGERYNPQLMVNELKKGNKIIWFANPEDVSKIQQENNLYIDAHFLSLHVNLYGISLRIIDGRMNSDDRKKLQLLEKGDTSFNLEQYEVEHADINNNMIIEAGAGTGKTHVMINRILFLMHTIDNLHFSDIAMITFTNEATDNMRHKLISAIEDKYRLTRNEKYINWLEELIQMNISTIHSFFKRIIIEVGPVLGFSTKVSLKSFTYQKKEILKDILNEKYGNSEKKVKDELGLSLYQLQRLSYYYWGILENKGLSEKDIKYEYDWGETSDIQARKIQSSLKTIFSECGDRYNFIKKRTDAISMKDILHELNRCIGKKDFEEHIVKKYRFIFCDEFQDSDDVQIESLASLNNIYNSRLFVVGDVKQSIYRFRGATDSAFTKLKDNMKKQNQDSPVTYKLVKNYRTSTAVLEQFDMVFSRWGSMRKPLLLYREDDKLLGTKSFDGKFAQLPIKDKERREKFLLLANDLIAKNKKKIEESRKDKKQIKPERIMVLARRNSELSTIKSWCRDEGLVCHIKEKGSFYRSPAVLDMFSLISSMLYYEEPMYLYGYMESAYYDGFPDISQIMEKQGNKEKLYAYLYPQMDTEWMQLIDDVKMKPLFCVLLEFITKKDPTRTYAKKQKKKLLLGKSQNENATDQALIDARQYDADLQKLLQIMFDTFSGESITATDILDFLSIKIKTDNDEDQADIYKDESMVYLEGLTVHGAKGLEFDNVILPFMENQFYTPLRSEILISKETKKIGWVYRKDYDSIDICNKNYSNLIEIEKFETSEEETRLLYVAMTRTIQNCYAFCSRGYRTDNRLPSKWSDLLLEENDDAEYL